MSKTLLVFITSIIFFVSVGVLSASSYGMGINNNKRDSPEYKAALSFVIISSISIFTSVLVIAYHSTKLYCS